MKIHYFILFFIFLCLTACSFKHKQSTISKTQSNEIMVKNENIPENTPTIVTSDPGYYVDARPISLTPKPWWATQIINIRAKAIPFQLLMSHLLANTPLTVSYDDHISLERPINLHFRGTLQAALKALSATTHYAYSIQDNVIKWSALENKTFDIAKTNNPYQHNETWSDLRNTLQQLKSKEGRIILSQATDTVTINDHPDNLNTIQHYIEKLNCQNEPALCQH